jgi:hypothetical protein
MGDITPETFYKEVDQSYESMTDLQRDELWRTKYQGRNIRWTGRIDSIEETSYGFFVVVKCVVFVIGSTEEYNPTISVYCSYDKTDRDRLLRLDKGQRVVVTATLGDKRDSSVGKGKILFDAQPENRTYQSAQAAQSGGGCLVMCAGFIGAVVYAIWKLA